MSEKKTKQKQGSNEEPVVKLTKPLERGSDGGLETIDKLIFREPIGLDFEQCGEPFNIIPQDDDDAPTKIELKPKAINRWIAQLAGVPIGVVRKMNATDRQAAMGVVLKFMGKSAEDVA
ncbi:hypothetical protein [Pyruvatibacter sp.]